MKKTLLPLLALCFGISGFSQVTRIFSTYYGGSGDDVARSLATDMAGNVYMAGYTTSTGMASGGFQNSSGGNEDAFLAKFDAAGNRLWATYYGGPGSDYGISVALDPSGNIYLSGYTTSTSGIASGGYQTFFAGGTYDLFLVKFDPSGNRLWATYYGGPAQEQNGKVATDGQGNVFLGGHTASTTGIASGGYQTVYGGGSYDAFLVKFNSSGSRLWASYVGGSDYEEGNALLTDLVGNIYFAGGTQSTNNIALQGNQMAYAGLTDGFIVKLDINGNQVWGTYLGGADFDVINDMTIELHTNTAFYVSGTTYSSTGIAVASFQNNIGGSSDGFVVKYGVSGSRWWGAYWGGTGQELGTAVCTDTLGNVYLSGNTQSTGIASGGFMTTYGGGGDAYLVAVSGGGADFCSTYFGGSLTDNLTDIAYDFHDNIYIGGLTFNNTGISHNGFQNSFGGGAYDAMLAKFYSCGDHVGITELNNSRDFLLYPNPSSGIFTIEARGELIVSDMMGQKILTQQLSSDKTTIDLHDYARGVYIVELVNDKQRLKQKLVLQ